MSLLSSVSDMYLRRHIRSLLERYYALQGINMKDLERKTNRELIDLLKKVLENQENKINELQTENDTMYKKAEKMQDRNKDLELKNDQLYDRNEKLIKTLNEKEVGVTSEKEVLRGLDGELNMETEKHMAKLQRCKTKTEAAAEVAFHMSREYFIREKYKEHGMER
jgi:hypothetical protein